MPDQLPAIIKQAPLVAYTDRTHTTVEDAVRDAENARERRFSTEVGEYQPGFSCAATAFQLGDEYYTVSLSSPEIPEHQLLERGHAVSLAVREVTSHFGPRLRCDAESWNSARL